MVRLQPYRSVSSPPPEIYILFRLKLMVMVMVRDSLGQGCSRPEEITLGDAGMHREVRPTLSAKGRRHIGAGLGPAVQIQQDKLRSTQVFFNRM